MRLRIVLVIVAIIIGAIAVFAVINYVTSIKTATEADVEKIEVLVAVKNIPNQTFVETLLSSNSIILEAIPRKYLAEGVLTSLDKYKGYVTAAPISKGSQITSTDFIKPEQVGLAFNIPSDMVAVSIPVNEVVGVSNLIKIGDKVNVIATFLPPEQNQQSAQNAQGTTTGTTGGVTQGNITPISKFPITKTLLWNVKVLYVGLKTEVTQTTDQKTTTTTNQAQNTKIVTVTIAVAPEDAEKLVFSEEIGHVWLALLPTEGIEKKDTEGRTLDNIFN